MAADSLDLAAAAALMGLHPDTLAKRARAGEVPGAKLGRGWIFRREDILGILDAQIAAQTAARAALAAMKRAAMTQPSRGRPRTRRRPLPLLPQGFGQVAPSQVRVPL